MSGHTKAPLSGKTVKVCFIEFEKLGITVSIPQYADAEAKANSRRMIACFEALEGLTTEQIEECVFKKMREDRDFLAAEVDALTRQRDELLEALCEAVKYLEPRVPGGNVGVSLLPRLKCSIAKAKGGAA